MAPAILLREKVDADLPEITDLWVASWNAAMPQIDFETRRVWFVERMATLEADGATTIVALAGGDIVGFVVIDPSTGYLDQIAVLPLRQGSEVAAALMAQAKRRSPAGVDLLVNKDNGRAVRFYEKEGFVITGETVNERSGAPVHKMSWRPK